MNSILNGVVVVITAIIGVAILAVILSPKSQTAEVLKAGSGAFSGALGTALSPIVGGNNFVGGF